MTHFYQDRDYYYRHIEGMDKPGSFTVLAKDGSAHWPMNNYELIRNVMKRVKGAYQSDWNRAAKTAAEILESKEALEEIYH